MSVKMTPDREIHVVAGVEGGFAVIRPMSRDFTPQIVFAGSLRDVLNFIERYFASPSEGGQ